MTDIATPSKTQEILNRFGHSAKKSLGQNFIIDRNILENMVDAADVDADTIVIEIGPGIGALTEQIAKRARHVYAFEIDRRMVEVLGETVSAYDNIDVIHRDVLEVDWDAFASEHELGAERLVVLANLPYYITTPILTGLLESSLPADAIVLMMQKEVAERLQARPNSKAYSSLSIAVQRAATVEVLFDVPPTVFIPRPNVTSAVISFTPKPATEDVLDEEFFTRLVRASFKQRRKTLWNNLKPLYPETDEREVVRAVLDEVEIDPSRRAESLSISEFVDLANALTAKKLNVSKG